MPVNEMQITGPNSSPYVCGKSNFLGIHSEALIFSFSVTLSLLMCYAITVHRLIIMKHMYHVRFPVFGLDVFPQQISEFNDRIEANKRSPANKNQNKINSRLAFGKSLFESTLNVSWPIIQP